MTSINDQSYPVKEYRPQGRDPSIGHVLPPLRQYFPPPQTPVLKPIPERFYINTASPNPFTVKPISTEWRSNYLIMMDPRLRTAAGTAPLDIAAIQATNYVSPQHLNMGWEWCNGALGWPKCSRRS